MEHVPLAATGLTQITGPRYCEFTRTDSRRHDVAVGATGGGIVATVRLQDDAGQDPGRADLVPELESRETRSQARKRVCKGG